MEHHDAEAPAAEDSQDEQLRTPDPAPSAPPRRSARWLGVVALLLVLAGGGSGLWWYTRANAVATPPAGQLTIAQREEVFQAFWNEANKDYIQFAAKKIDWARVKTTYLKQLRQAPDDSAFNLVLLRAVAELKDTHTWLQVPNEARTNVNLLLNMDRERVVIRQVVPGTDAEAAGFKPGMEIVSVDGRPAAKVWQEARALSSDSTEYRNKWYGARTLLFGPVGSRVKVTAKGADGQTLEAALTRNGKGVPVSLFETRTLDGGYVYVKIGTWNDPAVMFKAQSVVQKAAETKPPGLIIDVRSNGGGDDGYAMTIVSYLTGKPTNWSYEKGLSTGLVGPTQLKIESPHYDGPVLVLTDPGCVSACDMFTVNVERTGRAKLVGEPPAGAAFIANDRKLPQGYIIHLSGGRELMGPDAQPIEGHPAAVAYPAAPAAADWAAGRDAVLEKALQTLAGK